MEEGRVHELGKELGGRQRPLHLGGGDGWRPISLWRGLSLTDARGTSPERAVQEEGGISRLGTKASCDYGQVTCTRPSQAPCL